MSETTKGQWFAAMTPRVRSIERAKLSTSLVLGVAVFGSLMISAGCIGAASLPIARDLCLSGHLGDLSLFLDEAPIPDDEFSQEYPPYPEHPSSDYETRYRRVFFTHNAIRIRDAHIKLAPGYTLSNDVSVFGSVKKAAKGFADMSPPRFGGGVIGVLGVPWDIPTEGVESRAWYHAEQVLDEESESMAKQIEAEISFREGRVVSSIRVTTWGGGLTETQAFLAELVRSSRTRIENATWPP